MSAERKWRIFAYSLVALASFFIALVIVGAIVWLRPAGRMEKDIAEIKKLGIPTDYNAIHALYPKQGSDAYDDYIQFLHVLEKMTPAQLADVQTLDLPGNEGTLDRRIQAADRLRPLFKDFIEGSKKDRWNLGRTLADDDSLYPFPINKRLERVYEGAKTYCRIALADGQSGRFDKALDELRTVERFAKQAGDNPLAMPQLESISLERRTLSVCRGILMIYYENAAVVKSVKAYIDSLPPQPIARDAVRKKVAALFPAHEVDLFTELFWKRIQAWRADVKAP